MTGAGEAPLTPTLSLNGRESRTPPPPSSHFVPPPFALLAQHWGSAAAAEASPFPQLGDEPGPAAGAAMAEDEAE